MKFSRESDDYSSVFASLVMIRFVILALALVFLAPKQDPKEDSNKDRGNLRVEVIWENNKDVDIDLWVRSPDDRPVGWKRKNGKYVDLIRDDLGNINNPSGIHYEIAYSKGAPEGEYVVNLHLYANREKGYNQVPVEIFITYVDSDDAKGSQVKIFQKKFIMEKVSEETTIVRFKVKADKTVDHSSFNDIYEPLYYAK